MSFDDILGSSYFGSILKGHKIQFSRRLWKCTIYQVAMVTPFRLKFWAVQILVKTKDGAIHNSLLLPGEMNISQIQCKIEVNTFLLCKSQNWCTSEYESYWCYMLVGWWVGRWFVCVFDYFGCFLRISSAYNLRKMRNQGV